MSFPLRLPTTAGLTGTDSFGAPCHAASRERLPYLAVTLLVLSAWAEYARIFPVPVFPLDDAYIVLHNAQTLLSGSDSNYSNASALSGTTSAVHLALVSGLTLFFRPFAALSAALWIAILLYGLGLVRLARVNGACRAMSALVALLGLTVAGAPNQLLNGLETGLMLAAVTWTLALLPGQHQNDQGRQQSWLLPVLCGILPFIRPDLLPLTLLFLGLSAARHWQRRTGLPDFGRRVGRDIMWAILAALPWILWNWREIGSVLPSTVSAKRFFFAQASLPMAEKQRLWVHGMSNFGGALGLSAIFSLLLVTNWRGRAGLVYGAVLLLAYYFQFPGALGQYSGRYLFPLLPFILLGAVQALEQPKKWLQAAGKAQLGKAARLMAVFLLALSLGQSLADLSCCWARYEVNCQFTSEQLEGVSEWCGEHLPAGSTLLIHDAGYISCRTRFHLVDLVGLKTPSSISYHRKLTYPSAGANRFLAISQIALRGHTNYLVVLDDWDRMFSISAGLKAAGWDVRLINGNYAYKVYALRPPQSARHASGT